MIEHYGECKGKWRLEGVYGDGWVLCEECGARFQAGHEAVVEAVDQNYLDARLRELAEEGAALLRDQTGGGWGRSRSRETQS